MIPLLVYLALSIGSFVGGYSISQYRYHHVVLKPGNYWIAVYDSNGVLMAKEQKIADPVSLPTVEGESR